MRDWIMPSRAHAKRKTARRLRLTSRLVSVKLSGVAESLMSAASTRAMCALRSAGRARVWWGILLVAAQLGAASLTRGDEVDPRHYNFRWYQADSGLPESEVTSLCQTPDGYIWCATFNGLARFDGRRFITFDPSNTPDLPTDRLIGVESTASGGLLVTTEFGDRIIYAGGRFNYYGKVATWMPLKMDEAGYLWTRNWTNDGLSWIPVPPTRSGEMKGPLPTHPQFQSKTLCILIDGKLRRILPSGHCETLDLPLPPGQIIHQAFSVDSGAWLETQNFLCFFDGRSITRLIKHPEAETVFPILSEDRDGALWLVGYHTDLYRLDAHENVPREVANLPWRHAAYTMTGMVDRENNIWIAVGGQGLLEVQPACMQRFGAQQGLKNDVVRSVAEDSDGNIWACTTRAVSIISSNRIDNLAPESFDWMACRRSTPGQMWLARYSEGLFVYTRTNAWRVTNVNNGAWASPDFTFLFQDSHGLLWFGNSSGLFSYDGTNTVAASLPGDLRPDPRVLVEAKDGALAAGCDGQGLFVREKDSRTWRHFGAADGLESEQIYSLKAAAAGSLWVGTSGAGLARFDGRRFVFFRNTVNQLPRTVTGIEEDDLGYLWLGSTRAIFRVKTADLLGALSDPARSVAFTEYGREYGIPRSESVVGVQPSVLKGRDGRIWFATTGGVICFDPRNIPSNPLPPPVIIEALSSSSIRLDLTMAPAPQTSALIASSPLNPGVVIIQPGVDPVELEYTGLSFTAPENVQFRYRMEGLETNWVKTRDRHAVYQRLPPGKYTFRVLACNNDGVWNQTGASLAIVQLPFFWETAWFKAALAVAIASLIYAAHRYRLAQLARVGRLRAQIAADLHDEVGSNMGAVVLNSDLLTMSPNLSDSEREQLADIHRIARNTAQAVREISWFINPDFDFLDEMIARMKEAAGRLSKTHHVNFAGPDHPPRTRLALEFRRHVMAIYKEALTNAARHAGASRIDVTVRLQSDHMELAVRDDGRGFAPGHLNGGQGLRNLRQRADAVAGRLEIESIPGAGTTIRFAVDID